MKRAAILIFCQLVSIPLVGFVYGLLNCQDCSGSVTNYLIVGVANAIFAIFGAGYLYVDQMRSFNAWPFILPLGFVLYAIVVTTMRLRQKAVTE